MPTPKLTAEGKARLDALLDKTEASGKWPAFFFAATTAEGEVYFNAKGPRIVGQPEQVDADTTLQLFSMTKMITSIACIQLWQRGQLAFDDAELITTHLPELASQPILTGFDADDTPIYAPRTRPLTLRHLLTHTSGVGYEFSSPALLKHNADHPNPWFKARATVADLAAPLLFEPGSHYCYSLGIDWAGLVVERLTNSTLEAYFREHIFGPLGLSERDITFYPTDDIKARLMQALVRQPDGSLLPGVGMRDVAALRPEDITLRLGGAGLFGTAKAHLAVVREVLACGSRDGVLNRKGYEMLFTDALGERSGSEDADAVAKDLGDMMVFEGLSEEKYTSGKAAGHSVGLCLSLEGSRTGRKKGTGWWSGAAKTRFWIDPETGIAGWCGTQLWDTWPNVSHLMEEFETTLYGALE